MKSVIELAKEAGFVVEIYGGFFGHTTLEHRVNPDRLEAFAALVRAEALEEAAKVCETKEIPFDIELWCNSTKKEMTAYTAIALAAAIRGMK